MYWWRQDSLDGEPTRGNFIRRNGSRFPVPEHREDQVALLQVECVAGHLTTVRDTDTVAGLWFLLDGNCQNSIVSRSTQTEWEPQLVLGSVLLTENLEEGARHAANLRTSAKGQKK
jgi:hypothetical protein